MKKAWVSPEITKLDVKLTENSWTKGGSDIWVNQSDPTLTIATQYQ